MDVAFNLCTHEIATEVWRVDDQLSRNYSVVKDLAIVIDIVQKQIKRFSG